MDGHTQQQRIRNCQDAVVRNEQDKGGIEVNWKSGVDFAVVLPDTIVEVEVQVVNTTEHPVSFGACRVTEPDEQDKLYVCFPFFFFFFGCEEIVM
jgi:helicase MOV-10